LVLGSSTTPTRPIMIATRIARSIVAIVCVMARITRAPAIRFSRLPNPRLIETEDTGLAQPRWSALNKKVKAFARGQNRRLSLRRRRQGENCAGSIPV
jgi:hypothetical protein